VGPRAEAILRQPLRAPKPMISAIITRICSLRRCLMQRIRRWRVTPLTKLSPLVVLAVIAVVNAPTAAACTAVRRLRRHEFMHQLW
jgi:hypothetical protein